MRKHSPRKLLHAVLDLLPVILIPVFMIYSHRHDLSTDITYTQDVYKDFYQGVKNGKPSSLDYINTEEVLETYVTNNGLETYIETQEGYFNVTYDIEIPLIQNNYYFISLDLTIPDTLINNVNFEFGDEYDYLYSDFGVLSSSSNNLSLILQSGGSANDSSTFYFNISSEDLDGYTFYFKNVMLFDLTSIFGSGNEPSKEVFESYLTQDYYDFGNNQVKVGTTQVTAKNNDIMSVFTDSFNNTISKYFDMGNVFGFKNVYQWFNTNLFGGSAPQVVYSVYVIIVYEFVMDLIFLLYSVFMFIIDFAERLMDSFFDKSFGGGR